MKQPRRQSTTYGFSRADSLMQARIRRATEGRGFAESRLLTHWAEIVGEATAAIARPVEVSYKRGGLGATLTVLTTGANAPMLEMQKVQLLERVNACYGYRAIARLRITQTAPTGFADGRASFAPAPVVERAPDPQVQAKARDTASGVGDDKLRHALESLVTNYLTKTTSSEGQTK